MTTERLDNIDQRLAQLVTITERQAATAERQSANIERLTQSVEKFAGVFAEQAKAITELSRDRKRGTSSFPACCSSRRGSSSGSAEQSERDQGFD